MNNDRIQEIREEIEQVEDHELEADVFDVIIRKPDGKIIAEVFDSEMAPVFANAIKNQAYLLSQVERLQEENRGMKEVLRWYSNMRKVCESEHLDGGKRAIAALSHLKGE